MSITWLFGLRIVGAFSRETSDPLWSLFSFMVPTLPLLPELVVRKREASFRTPLDLKLARSCHLSHAFNWLTRLIFSSVVPHAGMRACGGGGMRGRSDAGLLARAHAGARACRHAGRREREDSILLKLYGRAIAEHAGTRASGEGCMLACEDAGIPAYKGANNNRSAWTITQNSAS